jgi:pimeloyl-ACP methyl ester carboxylesterase
MAPKEDHSAMSTRNPRAPLRRGFAKRAAAVLLTALALVVPTSSAIAYGAVEAPAAGPTADDLSAVGTAALGSEFRQGRVTIDGGQIFYVISGSGPPLVLLHGWPETWWSWHSVMPALSQRFTVIALDLPGLGRSSIPASGYDKATTARRVRQAVRALGYTRVAYDYARDFPADVIRLAVLETPLSGFGLEQVYGISWHLLFNASAAPVPETILDNNDVPTYLNWLFDSATHHPEAIDRPVYFAAYSDPARRTAGFNYYRAFAADAVDNQANAESKRLTMPVMAMGAEFVFGAGVAASFRAVASDVREVIAPDSGHWIPEENPTFLIKCANLFFGPIGVPPPTPDLAGCAA